MSFGFRENANDADWLHLVEGEQVRWSGRPSFITILPAMIVMALLFLIGILGSLWARPIVVEQGWSPVFGYIPFVITFLGIAYGMLAYLHWLRILYVITDEEIYVKIGLISRDVTQVPLSRVQNTSYSQSVIERFLAFGTIHIYTAGTHTEDIEFESVPRPQEVKGIVTTQLSSHRVKNEPVNDGL